MILPGGIMEVTIVNPKTAEIADKQLYMALLYLGTILHRNGHKVNIVDAQIENAERKLAGLVKRSDCIGFSVMTTQVKHALELSDMVKSIDPEVPIVWGGVHPTLYQSQTAADKSVDYVVHGEGELTFLELMEFLSGKGKIGDIRGIAYKGNGGVRINQERPYLDLNTLSPPEWELLDMGRYVSEFTMEGVNYGKYLPVHSGRGCPYRCTFCVNTVLKARKWRPLTAENVFNETVTIRDRYKLDYVKFIDDNFFIDKKRVRRFCGLLIENRVDTTWRGSIRADYFAGWYEPELLELVRKSGCVIVAMGNESGSQKILDMIRKGITVEQSIKTVETCRKYGIRPICSFMMGFPHETREDIGKTIALIRKIKRTDPTAVIVGPQPYRPYPGCELYNEVKKYFKEPKTLRGWAGVELLWGFAADPKYQPWVENPEYVANLWFYIMRSGSRQNTLPRKLTVDIFRHIANLRLRCNLFGFPLDKMLFEYTQNLYYKRKNKSV